MTDISTLASRLQDRFAGNMLDCSVEHDEVTVVVERDGIKHFCELLRDEPGFEFKQLTDITAVDYLDYGCAEWDTSDATTTGFDRGVKPHQHNCLPEGELRFAVVYHLLSISNNQRVRVKVFLCEKDLKIDSVSSVWPAANWFERETFDMFGVEFNDHPDLRRILTDYGFVGHPFRKDFPLSGYVEVRYDAAERAVVYEPVDIEPRTLVPKVIRMDNRYLTDKNKDVEHAGD